VELEFELVFSASFACKTIPGFEKQYNLRPGVFQSVGIDARKEDLQVDYVVFGARTLGLSYYLELRCMRAAQCARECSVWHLCDRSSVGDGAGVEATPKAHVCIAYTPASEERCDRFT
jgi:hypothetical protein